MSEERLEQIARDLEAAAERLRSGDLSADEAADLVERCAALAGELGGELDRATRATGDTPGQEQLL